MLQGANDELDDSHDCLVECFTQRRRHICLRARLLALAQWRVVGTAEVFVVAPRRRVSTVANRGECVREAKEYLVPLVVSSLEAVDAEDARRVVGACSERSACIRSRLLPGTTLMREGQARQASVTRQLTCRCTSGRSAGALCRTPTRAWACALADQPCDSAPRRPVECRGATRCVPAQSPRPQVRAIRSSHPMREGLVARRCWWTSPALRGKKE